MSRVSPQALAAAVAVATIAACTDAPVQPGGAPVVPRAAKAASQSDQVVPGELIVKLKEGARLDEVGRAYGLTLEGKGYKERFAIMAGARGAERAIAARLAADPRVEYAEPNYLRQPTVDPRLWAFHNPGGLNMKFSDPADSRDGQYIPSSYASTADADEDNVDGYAAGGSDVVIGSLDTGVDFTHPEFTGRLIAGRDWIDGDNDPSDTPDEGHGTHTTGTMAGAKVGVAGVAGAAPHVKVYVQRVCGPSGCPTSAIINAINAGADYLDAGGKHLIAMNLSLGGSTESRGEKDAIARATSMGVLVIASAGNSGASKIACPSCDANAISVAATDWQDALAAYSQYGRGLDISAPGGYCYSNTTPEGCILSAVPQQYAGTRYDGPIAGANYDWYQGTSMAAPQVTGTAAIVASRTGLRGSALRDRLLGTADDLGTAGYDTRFGSGRLNSYRAVTGTTLGNGQ